MRYYNLQCLYKVQKFAFYAEYYTKSVIGDLFVNIPSKTTARVCPDSGHESAPVTTQ